VLEREIEIARKASSTSGKTVAVWEMKTAGYPEFKNEFVTEFKVAKPDKLWVKGRDISVWGDGQTLTVRSESLKQYIQVPFPPVDRLRETIDQLSGGQMKTFPGEALLRPDPKDYPMEETIKSIRAYREVKPGEYEGKSGVWVIGTGFDEKSAAGTPDYPVERFISDADKMTAVVKQDWTEMYNAISQKKYEEDKKDDPSAEAPRAIEKAKWTTTHQREMNAEISASAFVFSPAAGDVKVTEFIFKRPGLTEQVAMVGKMVPDIKGKDLDGNDVSLRQFKGKVLVMDFWATWCGPCVQGMPSMQAIHEKYKDKGLVLMGVNRDAKGKTEKVKAFLGRKGFTMPQMDDSGGAAADVFQAMSIPCVVFVDKEGIVQEIEVGYVPGKEKETEAKIVKLLAGEALRTADELEAMKKQVGGK
jgi:thiol-disulfide isomerase/thioredoxin